MASLVATLRLAEPTHWVTLALVILATQAGTSLLRQGQIAPFLMPVLTAAWLLDRNGRYRAAAAWLGVLIALSRFMACWDSTCLPGGGGGMASSLPGMEDNAAWAVLSVVAVMLSPLAEAYYLVVGIVPLLLPADLTTIGPSTIAVMLIARCYFGWAMLGFFTALSICVARPGTQKPGTRIRLTRSSWPGREPAGR